MLYCGERMRCSAVNGFAPSQPTIARFSSESLALYGGEVMRFRAASSGPGCLAQPAANLAVPFAGFAGSGGPAPHRGACTMKARNPCAHALIPSNRGEVHAAILSLSLSLSLSPLSACRTAEQCTRPLALLLSIRDATLTAPRTHTQRVGNQ